MEYWIVVVDDEVVSLTNAKSLLKSNDMKVSCLRSGADLLTFVENNTPDLILLDVMMPEMNGFETYQALREWEERNGRPPIPVIYLTGDQDSITEQKGLELGAADYIHKPFDKDILLPRIQNIIRYHRTMSNLTVEAQFDKLTGFLNKFHGTERISKLCLRKNGALIVMDLDSFKLVNDLYGHDTGDRVLQIFAKVMRHNTRETDTICRIGGDEFLAFYDDLLNEDDVAHLVTRINSQYCDAVNELLGMYHGIPLGTSVGIVLVPEYGRQYEELFSLADNALQYVKQNGKHGYHIYSQNANRLETEQLDPEQRLDRIIKIVEERNNLSNDALLLGIDSFALIYRFVMRFYRRYGGSAVMIMFTLTSDNSDNAAGRAELQDACTCFSTLLQKTLRASDIILQNGPNSFFVLLTDRKKAEVDGALQRIVEAWEKSSPSQSVRIDHVHRIYSPE